MRRFQLTLLCAIVMLFAACEKPANNNPQSPVSEVTYHTIAGAWELTEWNGKPLTGGTYLYIEFDGKEQRFDMWDNLGSMYVQHKTGTYTISRNEEEEFILSGQYDNGAGDWAQEYEVIMFAEDVMMKWSADDENMLFSRIDNIPELN